MQRSLAELVGEQDAHLVTAEAAVHDVPDGLIMQMVGVPGGTVVGTAAQVATQAREPVALAGVGTAIPAVAAVTAAPDLSASNSRRVGIRAPCQPRRRHDIAESF
jgi:hypothetical protein